VNIGDRYSFYPIHLAVMYADFRSVRALRAAGAQLIVKDHQRNLPLHYAARDQLHQILEFLLEEEPSSINALNVRQGQCRPIFSLLTYCPNARNRTRAQIATIAGCLKSLLCRGANVNVQNATQKTPLDIACKQRNWDCVRLLLLAGAEFDAKALRESLEGARGDARSGEDEAEGEEKERGHVSLWEDWRWCRRFATREPFSLVLQSRVCVRRSMANDLWKLNREEALGFLPAYVKNFIMMKEEAG